VLVLEPTGAQMPPKPDPVEDSPPKPKKGQRK